MKMKKILLFLQNYKKRMIRPIDWIKQPTEDILRLISKIIYLLIKILFHKKYSDIKVVNRVLIIRRNKLGDAISVLPLIQALKEKYPNITIDVIATPYNEIIFELSKSVNNIYTIPDRYLNNRYLVCFHPQMRKLKRQKNYDLAIGATGSYSSATAWLAFCAPATQRVGVISEKGSIMDLIYNMKVPQKKIIPSVHQVKKIALLAKYANIINQNTILPMPKLDINTTKSKTIALCPLTDRQESKWSDNNWIELACLLKKNKIKYNWIGYKPKSCNDEVLNPNSTIDFIQELSRYSLVVCSEGGTSHVAPALNCATIIISGVNISKSWIPWSDKIILFEKKEKVNSINPEHIVKQIRSKLSNGCFLQSDGGVFNESFSN